MIVIYADRECFTSIDTIRWDSHLKITLFNGEEEVLPNTAEEGSHVTATFFVKNDGRDRFVVTDLSFPDLRVKVAIENVRLDPYGVVQIQLSYDVPEKVSEQDVIEAGQIKLEGYYIIIA